MLKLNKPVVVAIVFSSFTLFSCANNPGTASTATAASGAPLASQLVSSGGGGTTTTQAFTISQVSPPAGTLSSVPNPIEVIFSGTSVDSATGSNTANYTLTCSNGVFNPSSVSIAANYAMLTFSALSIATVGTSCSLNISANVKDGSGDSLSGTRTTSYSFQAAVSPTADVTAPVGSISSPAAGDRVYGSVTLGAYAYDTGANQSGVASVEFMLDGTSIGTSTSAPYDISFNTATFPNGQHTLSINVTDKAGNAATTIDSRWITIGNYAYTTTLTAGGTGGTAFTDTAPAENALMGLQVRSGSYIDALQPVYQNSFGSDIVETYGLWHGGTGGGASSLQCPQGYLVTGLTGTADSYVDSLSIVCTPANGQGSTWTSPSAGTGASNFFTITCPANKFATRVLGRAGSYIDQLQLGCK